MKITDKKRCKGYTGNDRIIFEDINFAADGGLYAEMIENRSFEAKEAFGTPETSIQLMTMDTHGNHIRRGDWISLARSI